MRLSCRECDTKLQEERGCNDGGIIPFYIGEKQYFRCPLKLITPLSWEYIKAHKLYQKNILPNNVGGANESDKVISAMFVLEDEIAELEKAKADKKKRKRKNGRQNTT